MCKRKVLFLTALLLFGLQLTGCVWHDRDYQGHEWDHGWGTYDRFGRDEYGFPRGHEHQ